MIRTKAENINTEAYWTACYEKEDAEGKARVDAPRLEALTHWVGVRREEVQRHGNFLDLGCGLGDVAQHFAGVPSDLKPHYSGVDLSGFAVEKCREKFKDTGCEFYVGGVEKIPFSNEMFDVVWCGETLEHLDNPHAGVREIARVTAEGGFMVLSTPYRGRNRSPEHVWEFEPADIVAWAAQYGELVCLRTEILPSWLTMFAVIRRRLFTECS